MIALGKGVVCTQAQVCEGVVDVRVARLVSAHIEDQVSHGRILQQQPNQMFVMPPHSSFTVVQHPGHIRLLYCATLGCMKQRTMIHKLQEVQECRMMACHEVHA